MAIVSPPTTWLRPVKVYIDHLDNTEVLIRLGPTVYARSFFCDLNPKKDVYFQASKPSWILSDQWEWRETQDSWLWAFDYQDNTDCAPNLALYLKQVSVNEDQRTGLATIRLSLAVTISGDPFYFVEGMESAIAFRSSYFVLRLKAPHPVLDLTIDGEKREYYYQQDGSVQLIIELPGDVPGRTALSPFLPLPHWVLGNGYTVAHDITLVVKTGAVVTSASTTIMATQTFGQPGTTVIPAATTYVLTVFRTATVTSTVTSYNVVSATTTVYRGQTVTTYIPIGTTIYNPQTFTYTAVRTERVTHTVTQPTTITEVVYSTTTVGPGGPSGPSGPDVSQILQETLSQIVQDILKGLAQLGIWLLLIFAVIFLIIVIVILVASRGRGERARQYRPHYRPSRYRMLDVIDGG
ncbi:MAG: hypothetical protein QW580_01970 [Nitrososphaerota archaeon]